jgi:ketosteroid isomerase-like protein
MMIGCGLLIFAASCKIERTPEEFFDQQVATTLTDEAAEELRAHVLNLVQALNRGDRDAVMAALAPRQDAYVVGPEDGSVLNSAEEVEAAMQWIAALGPVSVQVNEIRISADSRGNVGWFSTSLDVPGLRKRGASALRMTGVYVRDEGRWRLAQAHLSLPTADLLNRLPTYPRSPADSPAGGSAAPPPPSPAGGS